MSEDMGELARQAANCKAMKWKRGMRALGQDDAHPPIRLLRDELPGGDIWFIWDDGREPEVQVRTGYWFGFNYLGPDLEDPATLGCLLALLCELYDDPLLHVMPSGPNPPPPYRAWKVLTWRPCGKAGWLRLAETDTKAEALVSALVRAPLVEKPT